MTEAIAVFVHLANMTDEHRMDGFAMANRLCIAAERFLQLKTYFTARLWSHVTSAYIPVSVNDTFITGYCMYQLH